LLILNKSFLFIGKAYMRQAKSVWILLLLAGCAATQQSSAQQASTHHTKPVAIAAPAKPELSSRLPTEETVNSFLQQMFGYDSSLSWKVADIRPSDATGLTKVTVVVSSAQGQQVSVLYVAPDGKHALTGELIPFGARPFEADWEQLEKGINGPGRGPVNAPVTIVEFSDLQCPHCKDAQPILEKLMAEEPNVRLVFQNFPLAIPAHDWAAKGAAYADCVAQTSKGRASVQETPAGQTPGGQPGNDPFWKFIHDVYDAQTTITAANADEKLTALADQSGVKGADIAACAALPETTARVEQSVAFGKDIKVTGTPTLFVNGRRIENLSALPYDVLKKLVDFAATGKADQPAAKPAEAK
jgi:protein-disulfide isomerase